MTRSATRGTHYTFHGVGGLAGKHLKNLVTFSTAPVSYRGERKELRAQNLCWCPPCRCVAIPHTLAARLSSVTGVIFSSRLHARISGVVRVAQDMKITYTDSVICYKELIEKEDAARRLYQTRYGGKKEGRWRPIEPFEATSASGSKLEMPAGVPQAALKHPELFRDSVGDDALTGGTAKRFGGRWDVTANNVPIDHGSHAPRVVKKGPHDCYCDIGFNAWSMAGKARTHNFGLKGVFERDFWTNTPGYAPGMFVTCVVGSVFVCSRSRARVSVFVSISMPPSPSASASACVLAVLAVPAEAL